MSAIVRVEQGINWIFYISPTFEDAMNAYKERHGRELNYPDMIWKDRNGEYNFREHK